MEYQQLRSRRQINPKESKPPVDGKIKGSFFTYQRLCENSLATWWRNVFLMSNVALNIEKLGTEPELVPILFLGVPILVQRPFVKNSYPFSRAFFKALFRVFYAFFKGSYTF